MIFEDLFIKNEETKHNNESNASDEDEGYSYEHLESIEKLLETDSEDGNEDEKELHEGFNHFDEGTNPSQGFKESQGNKYKLINRRIDANRIRHKMANNFEIHTSVCENIKIRSEGPIRSGAIIYTHHLGETYFCMGIDSCYGDLTDFAGGVKGGESIIRGGLRELYEESLGIFGELSEKNISQNLAFYSNNMVIMFIRLQINIEKSKRDFLNKIKEREEEQFSNKLEVSNIYWLKKSDFLDSIHGKGKKMYNRVQKILSKVTDIIQAL